MCRQLRCLSSNDDVERPAGKGLHEDTQGGVRITAKIVHFVGGFPTTDDRPPHAIDAHGHRRHLEAAIPSPRGEDRSVVFTQKLLCDSNIHKRYPLLKEVTG